MTNEKDRFKLENNLITNRRQLEFYEICHLKMVSVYQCLYFVVTLYHTLMVMLFVQEPLWETTSAHAVLSSIIEVNFYCCVSWITFSAGSSASSSEFLLHISSFASSWFATFCSADWVEP